MEFLAEYPIIKMLVILIAAYVAFKTLMFSAEMAAYIMTILVMIVVITPGAIAADRALKEVSNVNDQTDHRQVEKMREAIMSDMMRSAKAYQQYPEQSSIAHKISKTLAG